MSRLARLVRALALASILAPLAGCISGFYDSVDPGYFEGRGQLEWVGPNRFIFRVDPQDPMRFTRADKATITLGDMYTDGGSVPSVFWSLRNYSPWWYGPAYLVHDWLFHVHTCKLPGDDFTFEQTATILSEAMKTLMLTNEDLQPNAFVLYTVHEGVLTSIARSVWNSPHCLMPPEPPQHDLEMAQALRATVGNEFIMRFDFSSPHE